MEGRLSKRPKLEWRREDFSDPSRVLNLSNGSKRVWHIGRELTEKMLSFIDISPPRPSQGELGEDDTIPEEDVFAIEKDGFYGFRFIVGPPGTGKSTSLRAAVKYLSSFYSAESPVTRCMVFIRGSAAAMDAEAAVASAIGLKVEAGGSSLGSRIREFFEESEVRYTLVVDDGNQIPAKGGAALFLTSLVPPCEVVLCSSASSDWMNVIRKPKIRNVLVVNENLGGDELKAFCKRYKIDLEKVDLHRTGTNPRLLLLYSRNLKKFEEHVSALKVSAGELLAEAVVDAHTRFGLLQDMTGMNKVGLLSKVNDTRCLFATDDGSLDCISEELHKHCLKTLALAIAEPDLNASVELVAEVTRAIRRDRNLIRMGWNSEAATIIAVKLLDLTFIYATEKSISLGRPFHTLFSGEMSAGVLMKPLPRLYVPVAFSHLGLDLFVETEAAMIAFQVSLVKNAEKHHKHTRPKAEKLFRAGGKSLNILVFVTPGGYSSELVTTPEGCKYYLVTMPFAHLSKDHLGVIDDTVAGIRGSAEVKDKCSKCDRVEGCDDWVQCDVCLLWYHSRCVGFAQSQDCYECYQCKDFIKRRSSLRRRQY